MISDNWEHFISSLFTFGLLRPTFMMDFKHLRRLIFLTRPWQSSAVPYEEGKLVKEPSITKTRCIPCMAVG